MCLPCDTLLGVHAGRKGAGLTTPSGSTSSRCLGRPQCIPVRTYWPGLVVLSRTRKSPSRTSSLSASRLFIRLWYHASLRSCSSLGATGARRRGGLGHWSSRTWMPTAAAEPAEPAEPGAPPHASWSFRASSKGPSWTETLHNHMSLKLDDWWEFQNSYITGMCHENSLMSNRSFLGLSGGLLALAASLPSRFRLSRFWVFTYWCSS